MSASKISALIELLGANAADDDMLVIVDKSDTTQAASGSTKKIQRSEFLSTVADKTYADDGDAATLTAAQNYSDGPLFVHLDSTPPYTLRGADASGVVKCDWPSNGTVTVPSATFAEGDVVRVIGVGAGSVIFEDDGVLTLHAPFGGTISTRYGSAEVFFLDAGEAIVSCD